MKKIYFYFIAILLIVIHITHCESVDKKYFPFTFVNFFKTEEKPDLNYWNKKVRRGWLRLPKARNWCPYKDIKPSDGIRSLYCYLKDLSNIPELEYYFGKDIFIKGPHKEGFLILDDPYQFGYYHPDFPKFIRETLVPAAKDPAFQRLTQPIYNQYLKEFARTFYATREKLKSNPLYYTTEKIRYKKLIQEKRLDPFYFEKYFNFMQPGFTDDWNPNTSSKFLEKPGDENFNGNIVKVAVLFWIRRSIDGTEEEFFKGLKLILLTYDKEFIRY